MGYGISMKCGLTGQVSVNSAGGAVRVMEEYAKILGSNHGTVLIFKNKFSRPTSFYLHRATYIYFFKFSCLTLFYLSRATFYKFKTKKSRNLYHPCINISILCLPKIVMLTDSFFP